MIALNGQPLEIERKFLIRYPDISEITAVPECRILEIVQTYLFCDTGVLRVRKVTCNNKTKYILTEKRDITDVTRYESETEIDFESYTKLLSERADSESKPLVKTRYAFPCGRHTIEIDVYPFWNDRAIMEIELECESEEFPIPDFIEPIKEVTDDKRYSNKALAKEIFTENIRL